VYSTRHAKAAERMGVDMISMDGFDCAGHPGEADVGNWVLFPKAARELSIPFVASGGCGDGKQLAAAATVDAEGINMGTRFMATKEAPIKENMKNAFVDGSDYRTTLVMRSMKKTESVYKNKAAEDALAVEKEFPGDFKKNHHLVKGKNYRKIFQETGNLDDGVQSTGTSMGLIDSTVSCKELCGSIVEKAENIIRDRLTSSIFSVSDEK